MEKIYLANFHLPLLMAITLISIGCTFNSDIKLLLIRPKSFEQTEIKLNDSFETKEIQENENSIDVFDNNLVYLNENILTIKGINVELPFSRFSKPKIFINSKTILVGITDLTNNEIYLYKDNGELIEGFPIKGSSVIDIKDSDNDGKLEIISALDSFSIVSYEINLSQN